MFNFTVRYFNNTLATKSNMQKWGKALTKLCDNCPEVQTLNHVVAACKSALREGRYTWRHNSILLNLSLIIKSKVFVSCLSVSWRKVTLFVSELEEGHVSV